MLTVTLLYLHPLRTKKKENNGNKNTLRPNPRRQTPTALMSTFLFSIHTMQTGLHTNIRKISLILLQSFLNPAQLYKEIGILRKL